MDLNSDSKMVQFFAHSNQTGGHSDLKANAGYRIAVSTIKMASTRPWGILATALRRSRGGEKLGGSPSASHFAAKKFHSFLVARN